MIKVLQKTTQKQRVGVDFFIIGQRFHHEGVKNAVEKIPGYVSANEFRQ
ncbi:MAG: hypothetical protein ACMX3H_06865 [Sodalis sp. (in: enterobacteria)]